MTTKRTHGPCTCLAGNPPLSTGPHAPNCPSLYPAQHGADALTRLVRQIRTTGLARSDSARIEWEERMISLISEAREEQRKAVAHAENNGLERARKMASFEGLESLASLFEAAKKSDP